MYEESFHLKFTQRLTPNAHTRHPSGWGEASNGLRTVNRGTVNRGTIKRGQLIAGQLIAWTHNRSDN